MIKYASYAVTFEEVPDEVCLTIQISNCPHMCEGCHSSYLQNDIGLNLENDLPELLRLYGERVTCVCFMGTGNDLGALGRCVAMCARAGLKTALYSGYTDNEWLSMALEDSKNKDLLIIFQNLNYLKTGPYVKWRGGLDSPYTNQRMYKINQGRCEDITERFQKTYQ